MFGPLGVWEMVIILVIALIAWRSLGKSHGQQPRSQVPACRLPRSRALPQATPEQFQERQQQRTADTSRSIHDVLQQANRDARSVERARSQRHMARSQGWPSSRPPAQPTLAADYLNGIGKHFGDLTREGKAPNQTTQTLAPPKTMARVTGTRDGAPQFKAGRQFRGANAIIVRASCEAIGTRDPRVATVRSVNQTKENLGERGRAIKSVNPETGDRPKTIVLRSNRQQRQAQRHEQDGQGYDKDGNMGPVKAGDLKRDEKGHALQNTYERLGTYHAYHASDLNIQAMPEDRPPMSGEWADKYVAAKMAERAQENGEPVREATAEERIAILIERQMEKLCDMAQLHEFENAERDDYNFTVNAEGTPVIQVPAENPEVTLDQLYTSLAIACAHVAQFRSASDALARDAAPDGDINLSDERREQLQKTVDAYSLPEAERATNPDFSRADLVATYSAITEVTGHGGHYEAPESTRSREEHV